MGACWERHSLIGDRLFSDSLGLLGSRLQDRDLFLFAIRLIKLRYHLISAAHFLSSFDEKEREFRNKEKVEVRGGKQLFEN